jgi:2-polyprenyl-6-methoxyphenol hydroxylase-like FAD-dependent oxidoreductase
MAKLGDHALVLGGSISGLLAARVLSDFYGSVTVVERDQLSDDCANRRGVPQGRHPHALLARGAQTIKALFPGLLDDLVADGVPMGDDGDLSRFYLGYSGHVMVHSGTATGDLNEIAVYQPSRPMLECHIRRRLRALENVTIIDGHDVTDLTATPDRSRVTGAWIVGHDGGVERELIADLVVDAMGRAAHTPATLENLGYGRPTEDRIVMQTTYVSQALRIPAGTVKSMMILITPAPDRPTGLAMFRCENDEWIFTAYGMAGHEPPRDLPGMLAFVQAFAPPDVLPAVQAAEPIGPVVQHRMPCSQWRRYDKMRRFPAGLLVCGDAMCSFNPIYGQGMSVAAMDAMALQHALRGGTTNLSRRYFRAAAKAIGVAWGMGAGSDLVFPEVEGRRTPAMQLTNRFMNQVLTAAETDPAVFTQFARVTGLLDAPTRLFHPAFLYRVAATNRHRRQHDSRLKQAALTPSVG